MSETPIPDQKGVDPSAPVFSRREILGALSVLVASGAAGGFIGAEAANRLKAENPVIERTVIENWVVAHERLRAAGLGEMATMFEASTRFQADFGVELPFARSTQDLLRETAAGQAPQGELYEKVKSAWGTKKLTPEQAADKGMAVEWDFDPSIPAKRQKVVKDYAEEVFTALPVYAAALPPKFHLGGDIASLCGPRAGGCAAVDYVHAGDVNTDQEFGRVFPHEMHHRFVNALLEGQYGVDPEHPDRIEPGAFVDVLDQERFSDYVDSTANIISHFYHIFSDIPEDNLASVGVFGGYQWDGSRKELVDNGTIEKLANALEVPHYFDSDLVGGDQPDIQLRKYLFVLHKAMRTQLGKQENNQPIDEVTRGLVSHLINTEINHFYHNLHDAKMPRNRYESGLNLLLHEARDAHWASLAPLLSYGKANPLDGIDQLAPTYAEAGSAAPPSAEEGSSERGVAREEIDYARYDCEFVGLHEGFLDAEETRPTTLEVYKTPPAPIYPDNHYYLMALDVRGGLKQHYIVESQGAEVEILGMDNLDPEHILVTCKKPDGEQVSIPVNRYRDSNDLYKPSTRMSSGGDGSYEVSRATEYPEGFAAYDTSLHEYQKLDLYYGTMSIGLRGGVSSPDQEIYEDIPVVGFGPEGLSYAAFETEGNSDKGSKSNWRALAGTVDNRGFMLVGEVTGVDGYDRLDYDTRMYLSADVRGIFDGITDEVLSDVLDQYGLDLVGDPDKIAEVKKARTHDISDAPGTTMQMVQVRHRGRIVTQLWVGDDVVRIVKKA